MYDAVQKKRSTVSAKKKTEQQKLYFIAIVPPSPSFDEALALKHYFKENYQSKASLNSPPHITLHMPFKWREDKEKNLIDTLEDFFAGKDPVTIRFKGFGAFPPRVIFIGVEKNDELNELQHALMRYCKKELQLFNSNYRDLPFHPHLTLAFRDLKKHHFVEAWKEFSEREFETQFVANTVVLLKHTGKEWLEHHRFALQPQAVVH